MFRVWGYLVKSYCEVDTYLAKAESRKASVAAMKAQELAGAFWRVFCRETLGLCGLCWLLREDVELIDTLEVVSMTDLIGVVGVMSWGF
jgi:hypothetical protein